MSCKNKNMFQYNGNKPAETPCGTILSYAGASNQVLPGWLYCDGADVSRKTYSNLFNVIGTTYGAGDNVNTFNVPNLINKFIKGSSGILSTSINIVSGEEKHLLLTNEAAAHQHTGTTESSDPNHNHTLELASGYGTQTTNIMQLYGARITNGQGTIGTKNTSQTNAQHNHTFVTSSVGSGVPFSIIPSYIGLCFIIKY